MQVLVESSVTCLIALARPLHLSPDLFYVRLAERELQGARVALAAFVTADGADGGHGGDGNENMDSKESREGGEGRERKERKESKGVVLGGGFSGLSYTTVKATLDQVRAVFPERVVDVFFCPRERSRQYPNKLWSFTEFFNTASTESFLRGLPKKEFQESVLRDFRK